VNTAAAALVDPEGLQWTSGREFQVRNDARVLPPRGAAPAEQVGESVR